MKPKISKAKQLPLERMEYPFSEMEVGEEFTVSAEYSNSVRAAASIFGKKNNCKLTARTTDKGTTVVRMR